MEFILPEKYTQKGFNISKFGERSLVLKHYDRAIFIFGSDLDLRDDFFSLLCDSYVRLTSQAVEVG